MATSTTKQTAGAATTAGPGVLEATPPGPPVLPVAGTSDKESQAAIEETRKAATTAVEDAAAADAASLAAGDRKVVTGVTSALVTVTKPDGSLLYSAIVFRGQEVPAGVSAAELDRLDKLGVFDAPAASAVPQTEVERDLARRVARG